MIEDELATWRSMVIVYTTITPLDLDHICPNMKKLERSDIRRISMHIPSAHFYHGSNLNSVFIYAFRQPDTQEP